MTLRRNGADVAQIGGWQTGLVNHNAPAGSNAALRSPDEQALVARMVALATRFGRSSRAGRTTASPT